MVAVIEPVKPRTQGKTSTRARDELLPFNKCKVQILIKKWSDFHNKTNLKELRDISPAFENELSLRIIYNTRTVFPHYHTAKPMYSEHNDNQLRNCALCSI